MTVLRTLAPAKVNLGLFVGPVRDRDGRHELVSVMQSVSLADELTLVPGAADRDGPDEVVCPGLPGPAQDNLAARALLAFRETTGWGDPRPACSWTSRSPSPPVWRAAPPTRRRR